MSKNDILQNKIHNPEIQSKTCSDSWYNNIKAVIQKRGEEIHFTKIWEWRCHTSM